MEHPMCCSVLYLIQTVDIKSQNVDFGKKKVVGWEMKWNSRRWKLTPIYAPMGAGKLLYIGESRWGVTSIPQQRSRFNSIPWHLYPSVSSINAMSGALVLGECSRSRRDLTSWSKQGKCQWLSLYVCMMHDVTSWLGLGRLIIPCI